MYYLLTQGKLTSNNFIVIINLFFWKKYISIVAPCNSKIIGPVTQRDVLLLVLSLHNNDIKFCFC